MENPVPETAPQELAAAKAIITILRDIDTLGRQLEDAITPEPASDMALDDEKLTHYPLSHYAHGQLSVAFGCLETLRRMMVTETEDSIHLVASPHGPYALLRNAMDCAAIAAWLLQPESRSGRIKRRLTVEIDEISKSVSCRQELLAKWNAWAKKRRDRMQEIAETAEVGAVDVRKLKLPTMTAILRNLGVGRHADSTLPWLPAWQLCSGHAHGKLWARTLTNDLKVVEGTQTEIGATFVMTLNFQNFLAMLNSTTELVANASALYLASAQRTLKRGERAFILANEMTPATSPDDPSAFLKREDGKKG